MTIEVKQKLKAYYVITKHGLSAVKRILAQLRHIDNLVNHNFYYITIVKTC